MPKSLFKQTLQSESDPQFPRDSHSVVLDSCIEIITEKSTENEVSFQEICFHLTPEYISKIFRAKYHKFNLKLPEDLLDEFRNYVFIHSSDPLNCGFTFTTYYQENRQKKGIMRCLISLDGTVLQQIHRESLKTPDLVMKITEANYWLIQQLFGQLQLNFTPVSSPQTISKSQLRTSINPLLSWGLAVGIYLVVIALVLVLTSFKVNPILLLLSALIIIPLRWLIKQKF